MRRDDGLIMMRGILDMLHAIKKEMDKNGLTFEEFVTAYEIALRECEKTHRSKGISRQKE